MSDKLRIAVFASHGGSNLQSLIDACEADKINGKIMLVLSNNKKSYALERARNHSIEALHITNKQFATLEEYEKTIVEEITTRKINLICLAGYMKLLPIPLLKIMKGQIINIHPALLPKYGGKGMYGIHVHEAVLEAGEHESGVTIHQVNDKYDCGLTLAQSRVPVHEDDTPQSLQERVLKEEHKLYPETVAKIADGSIKLE